MGTVSGLTGSAIAVVASSLLFAGAAPAAMESPAVYENAQPLDAVPSPTALSSPWPVQFSADDRTFLIYQPQVDKWDGGRIEGRSAISVRDAAGKQNFGVAYFNARATTDPASGTVTISDAQVGKVDFPAVASGAQDYAGILRTQFAQQSWQVAQDKLRSDMEIDRVAQQNAKQPLRNDPPRILFSDRPAVLVPVDGNPVLRASGVAGFSRIVNTRALLLQEASTSRYDLFVSGQWMQSPSLQGPWTPVAANSQLDQAKQLAQQEDDIDLLDADDAGATPPVAPGAIFVTTVPAELLQTDGPVQYAPIEQTQLLYVTNSPDKLFLDLRTQNHYALISGRWYRTASLADGQWSYVPPAVLPADFAMIPADHPTESVRAAVPGTPQAREAVIASTVPQMATIARSDAHLEVNYDGSPVFQPIEGTSLQNAVNSPVPVIRVSENAFYALDNGVWFLASSPFGPWTVTSTVPPVIYSIPPSSPLYNVTYVRVYDATPEVVYVGYTPGYIGSYVSSDNVVVYGTGWPYRPWIGSAWYGAPVNWGFGFSFFSSWWHPYPWHYWHRTAWSSPRPFYRPWWGPWHARPWVAGGPHPGRSFGPPVHNVGRIYDRWDHRGGVWNGPRAIVNQHRDRGPIPSMSRPGPGAGFAGRPDGHWQRLGNDGRRDGRFDRDHGFDRNRGGVANAPRYQGPRPGQAITPPQLPRPAQAGVPQPRQFARDDWRRSSQRVDRDFANRPGPQPGLPQMRQPGFDRSERPRFNAQQDRPAPSAPRIQQAPRLPSVAGVPIQRAPTPQFQRPAPQARTFSPPSGRIERPASANGSHSFNRPQGGGGGGHGGGRSGERRGDGDGGRHR